MPITLANERREKDNTVSNVVPRSHIPISLKMGVFGFFAWRLHIWGGGGQPSTFCDGRMFSNWTVMSSESNPP
jgi:hypothetical protein